MLLGFELGLGAVVTAIPFGIRAVGTVFELNRLLKVKQEMLDSLERKVKDKLFLMAACVDVAELHSGSELVTLLNKAAEHIGTASAKKCFCKRKCCYQKFLHNAEVYFGISVDSLRILITDVDAYIGENRDLLLRARSQTDMRFKSRCDQERIQFQKQVDAHHRDHFGKLEGHFDEAMSGCFQPFNGFCSGSTHDEHEIERI